MLKQGREDVESNDSTFLQDIHKKVGEAALGQLHLHVEEQKQITQPRKVGHVIKGWVMFFISFTDLHCRFGLRLGTVFSREHQYSHPSRNVFIRVAWKESDVVLRLWFLSIFHGILQSFLKLKKFDDNVFQLLRVAQSLG